MIHVAVVGHAERITQAAGLAQTLAPSVLFLDDGSLGEWDNHERALCWGTEQTGHLLVIQDDAVPIDGLIEHCERAVKERPDDMIGLYVGQVRPKRARVLSAVQKADRLGASWLVCDELFWGVATILPCAAICALLAFCENVAQPYDERLGKAWCAVTERDVVYTWPSLVSHADGPSVITSRPQRADGRVAWRVGAPTWNELVVRL